MRLRGAVLAASARFAADSFLSETARRDAELLVQHLLGIGRAELLAYPDRSLSEAELAAYEAAIVRRLRHEPVQYITGQQEFYGLPFAVSPAVLIPRPETELLVEAVLERTPPDQAIRLLDVGAGSGAIAVTLAVHRPQAQVTAVDLSADALAIAQKNAQSNGVAERIRFLQSDLLSAVAGEHFDVIVSNPPYVPLEDRNTLHPQVREHEPELALFAGAEGLDVYTRLIPQAWNALRPGGLLAMEIGAGQQEAIAALLQSWQQVAFLNDLQGIARVALARRPAQG